MVNDFLDLLIKTFESESLIVLAISMAPILELRGSIPFGILAFNMNWCYVFVLSVLGNFFICIPLLYFLKSIEQLMRKNKYSDKIINFILNRSRSKSSLVKSYKYYGLMLFVAIPFPLTGAWTGSLISYLLNLDKKKSLLYIMIGLLISASITTLITLFFDYVPLFINNQIK